MLLSSPPSPSAGLGFEGASLAADFNHKSSHLLFVLFKFGHSLPKCVKIREVAESVPLHYKWQPNMEQLWFDIFELCPIYFLLAADFWGFASAKPTLSNTRERHATVGNSHKRCFCSTLRPCVFNCTVILDLRMSQMASLWCLHVNQWLSLLSLASAIQTLPIQLHLFCFWPPRSSPAFASCASCWAWDLGKKQNLCLVEVLMFLFCRYQTRSLLLHQCFLQKHLAPTASLVCAKW